jgi:hypothetical protein
VVLSDFDRYTINMERQGRKNLTGRWIFQLSADPIPALARSADQALSYFTRRDLLGQSVESVDVLWNAAEVIRLIRKQKPDGSWRYEGIKGNSVPGQNYSLLETFRNLRILVEMYGINRKHPIMVKAADYLFSCQTDEGDIRGIIGNQYMPYYHGAILELLIKSGYQDDPRVIAGLEWLLSMRQEDGGWIVPAQAVPPGQRTPEFWEGTPVMPERNRPHAHLATGMALRAFAAHPDYRRRQEVIRAGGCLKARFFKSEVYNDRRTPDYWLKFQYPFWWTNLVNALDSLSCLDFSAKDEDISRGLAWFYAHQEKDGLWPTGYDKGRTALANRRWIGLAICRVLKRFSSSTSAK